MPGGEVDARRELVASTPASIDRSGVDLGAGLAARVGQTPTAARQVAEEVLVFVRSRRMALFTLLAALVAGCASTGTETATQTPVSPSPTLGPSAAANQSATGGFDHVYVIVLENASYSALVGNTGAPYLNGLIAKYALSTDYYGVAHPSQPNYLAMFSGSTQGITDDANHDVSATNLADQLEAAGKTWRVFAQDYPGNCFTGATKAGTGEGIGAAGTYARKHNPAISFADISSDPTRCANITNLAAFDPAAASYELIVPNECNDMHSCPVAVADSFLSTFVPRIISSPAFANSVLFITTDEGEGNSNGGGQVATVVVSPLVKAGFKSPMRHDHYSLLRTIEDSWGLECLGQACSTNSMAEFFR